MISVRRNTFETNSSSTHCICIPTKPFNEEDYTRKTVHFQGNDFGWEIGVANPAEYLFTAYALLRTREETEAFFEKVYKLLDTANIPYSRADFEYAYSSDDSYYKEYHEGFSNYIDHSYELEPFLSRMESDDEALVRFLSHGVVYTGNDNESAEGQLGAYANRAVLYGRTFNHMHQPELYEYISKGN